ncbi:aminodeoxychorismate lyase [Paenibacillus curdlanolyticus YK9]|uniref:Aminodeoxychorismate lyase n=1 Tax=Paenibacillus curdlanolyticus YK9 TaxID=717606 RepID=E0I474_9BACL|nr:hypothetical protein [Paenibacillus curdlanolyticus]EFM13088.1 aminodeoxychorismate lyase [Paenibacillus curdlanolyticus YK9]
MFKDKRFLAGLGVGIIAGGLLLQVMIVGEGGTDNKSDERLYTEQEVQQLVEKAKLDKEAAEASGEQAKVDNTTNAGDSGKKPSEPAEVTPTKKPTDPSVDAPVDSKAPAAPEQPKQGATDPVTKPTVQETAKPVIIRIKPGSNLTQTAKILADNGIIDSQSKFIAKMRNDKKLVRAGYFSFTGKPTLQETVDILTSKPLSQQEADRKQSK